MNDATSNEQRIEGFPLSPQQRRIWRLSRGGDPAFVASAARPVSAAAAARLESRLQAVVACHEILRTGFEAPAGLDEPLQVIHEEVRFELLRGEGDGADPAAREALARQLCRPFDLAAGAPLRAGVLATADGAHLAVALPALCADRRSLELLLAVLSADTEVAEAAVQYADFAAWQSDQTEEGEGDPEGAWSALHAALAEPVRLPLERGAEGEPFAPRSLERPGPDSVDSLAAACGCGPEAVLLAAWQLLLRRLSGREDVVPAVADAGRPFAELDDALGAFAKYLPPSAPPPAAAPFSAAAAWAAAELESLRTLAPAYSADRLGELALPWGFTFAASAGTGAETSVHAERFAVHLDAHAGEGGLRLRLDRDGSRVGSAEAELLFDRLFAVLAAAAEDPSRPLGTGAFLGAGDRRIATRVNDTGGVPGGAVPLHHQILDRLAADPERIALVAGDGERRTAGELALEVGRLAAHLRRLGVGQGGAGARDRVAVLLERGPGMVTAVLAVLAAGGSFVPLDPEYPQRRLAEMLEDCAAAALLTTAELARLLPEPDRPGVVVCLDRDAAAIATAEPRRLPDPPMESLAYVIYTSGSTGRPKGVMVPHRAIANRVRWMLGAVPFTAADRFLLKTPASFDASLWELFVPLAAGATLVLAQPGGHRDPAYLAAAVREHRITVLQLVPSLLRAFLAHPAAAGCDALRHLFCGGEALAVELARQVEEVLPAVRLHNLYGPTETAIDATHQPWDGDAPGWSVPIGTPIAHLTAHVVDAACRPLPTGMAGELVVGGAGLARGYHGRPATTAAAFIPDPFATAPGNRLYRTGDRVRRLADGRVEFLGRLDHQVKVRGVRVEPGEVEGVLSRHPRVTAAVVAARPAAEGDLTLVAYVVPDAAGAVDETALRTWLGERLPPYLVPSRVVELEELPRTPSGKVDRRALPEPPAAGGGAAPRTPTEEVVAGIWAEVLKVERVGADDDFFELGGHSLLATLVASRLREVVGVELPLRTLLTEPTVAAQARAVEAARGAGPAVAPPPLEPVPRDAPLPLSFAQQRLWFLQRMEPETSAFNIPMAVRLEGELEPDAVRRAFAAIQRRHEVLRTTYHEVDGRPVQRVESPGEPDFELVDLSAADDPEAAVEEAVHRELAHPFDLERGPVQRIRLYRLGAAEHAALLVTHHIATDAWSMGLLIRELAQHYEALCGGGAAQLPELALQYADFAAWQRAWLRGEVLERQVDHWRRRLEGAPPVLELPTDRPRPDVASNRGRLLGHALPVELSEELRHLARRRGATLFMVVMAAFQALLHALTGRCDLVVGTDIANRNHLETESLVGFFINQLALRAEIDPEATFADLLRQTREATFDAYAHQELPFDKVVEALRPERSLRHAPIFQVKMNLQNVPAEQLSVAGLTLSAMELQPGTSQLDLILNLVDGRESLFGNIQYDVELFDEETVAGLWADYETVLAAVVGRPDIPLAELAEAVREAGAERQRQRRSQAERAGLEKLKRVRRRPVKSG